MNRVVIDASALLALLFREPGSESVNRRLSNAQLSAVNISEVVTAMVNRGVPADKAIEIVRQLSLNIIPFDAEQAYLAASLRLATRNFGLSLGDRACLALALKQGCAVLTADRDWSKLKTELKIEQIR